MKHSIQISRSVLKPEMNYSEMSISIKKEVLIRD